MLAAAIVLLPLAIADPPTEAPGATALAGLAGLILIPTFAGQLVLFRVLRLHGSRKLSIVTYLMPVFAVVYGAILLDEPVTAAMVGAFSLIVVGAVLASGQRFFDTGARDRGVTVSIRRATADDVGFLADLLTHEEVEPYLAAARPREKGDLLAEIERSVGEPEAFGLFVVEVGGERGRHDALRAHEHAEPHREPRRARHPSRLPRREGVGHRRADVPAPSVRRPRLPPPADGDLRLQRARDAPRRARGIHPRRRPPAGVLAERAMGRRRPLRLVVEDLAAE
jgi:hypothetical protein